MNREEAKNTILKRLYEAYMKEIQKLKPIDLKALAEKQRIDKETLKKSCIELEEKDQY